MNSDSDYTDLVNLLYKDNLNYLWIIIAELINSNNNYDYKSYSYNINELNLLKEAINKSTIPQKNKEKLLNHINRGLEVLLKEFEKINQ